jgi:mannonate dehydratase
MGMKIGLGLYPHLLTEENFRYARQVGATHIVAHLPGLSARGQRPVPANEPWTYEELRDLRTSVNASGLELAAIENFEPHHWSDVLLDGPRKAKQIAGLKTIIRNMGRAGIPVMGYNFSLAGVYGRATGPWARGGAKSVGYVVDQAPSPDEIPNGTVWNMVVDPDAPVGTIGRVSADQLWSRFKWFLAELLPVAEEAGVRLALHPDDPPLEELRGTARLVWKPELYRRVFELVPSEANMAEFCQGTVAEMNGDIDVYEAIEEFTAAKKIAYVHFRNVRGKVPNYHEMFVDDGDVDMARALHLYHKHGYDGVLIPDHTPGLECAAPWHAGMAYAIGWMRATIAMIERTGSWRPTTNPVAVPYD